MAAGTFTHALKYKGPKITSLKDPASQPHAAAAKSCPILCDPIDSSTSGSPVPRILQARVLEWVAISFSNACTHAKSLQSCPTLCDPMDSSPLDSPVHRILQPRILQWVAISFSITASQIQTKQVAFKLMKTNSLKCLILFLIFNLLFNLHQAFPWWVNPLQQVINQWRLYSNQKTGAKPYH